MHIQLSLALTRIPASDPPMLPQYFQHMSLIFGPDILTPSTLGPQAQHLPKSPTALKTKDDALYLKPQTPRLVGFPHVFAGTGSAEHEDPEHCREAHGCFDLQIMVFDFKFRSGALYYTQLYYPLPGMRFEYALIMHDLVFGGEEEE